MPLLHLPSDGTESGHVYIRPHELDIVLSHDNSGLEARIVHINPAGSVVKVRLFADQFGLIVNVDLSPDRYNTLHLKTGDIVCISPKKARMFVDDYAI